MNIKKSLISIDDLTKSEILHLISRAEFFLNNGSSDILIKKTCFNVFFEESTRTLSSFFSAFSSLGANVLNLNMKFSSKSKGETDFDSIINLSRLNPEFISIRHPENMFHHLCLKLNHINKNVRIINAGDGINEHPTQALGDFLLIQHYLNKTTKSLKDVKIVLFGDLKRSRVAHSHIKLFNKFNINKNVHLVAPIELSVNYESVYENLNYHINLSENILKDADIIMGFRFKDEYSNNNKYNEYISHSDIINFFQLNMKNLSFAKKDAIILHPGPINRDCEISSDIIDKSLNSVIFDQVEYGLAMRKAIIEFLYKD